MVAPGPRRRLRSRVAALATVAVATAALASFAVAARADSPSQSPSAPAGKTTLRLGWTADLRNLNPFIGYGWEAEVWALNYELLVGFRGKDMANVPGVGLATAWEVSDDGKTWTFTITDKSRWHDGKPLTARDVAFTFNYIIANEMGMYIDYVKFIEKVEAPDDTHVVFTCSKPKANMLALWIPILPEHLWSKVKPSAAERSYEVPLPLVGSGPFQVVEWKRGEFVRLVAKKDYWKGTPRIDEVVIQTYQNRDTMAMDLKAGVIQSAYDIPSAQFDALDAEPDLESIRAVTVGFDELGFNCADKKTYPKSTGHPVLQDPAFRRALQWAVDKDKIVALAYGGDAAPADTIVMRDYYSSEADYHWTPPEDTAYRFDLEQAKAALDEAGYPDSDGDGIREYQGKPIKLRLYSRTQSTASQKCGKFIAGWFEDIGLDIDYKILDEGALGDRQYDYDGKDYAPDFDMFLWQWGGDVDPNFILSVLTTSAIESWSDCNWSNAEYDRLFLEQQTTIDLQERLGLVHRMQQIVYDETPYIPLVYPRDLECANKGKWGGWVRANEGRGVWWCNTLPATYMSVHPVSADAQAGGGASVGLIVGVLVAAGVGAAIAVLLVRRRRSRPEVE